MKTIINEKTKINGTMAQVSSMELVSRETWVYRQFLSYAHKVSKYVASRHGLNDIECEYYIASGLYNKFLKLREKTLETCDGVHYNAIEYIECKHVLSLVRLVVNELNFKNATIEKKGLCLPDSEISFKNGASYKIMGAYIPDSIEYENISKMATRKIDIIDLLKQWENRDSRSESRKVRQFTRYIDDEGNSTSEETQVAGNYRTPEQDYFYNESIRQSLSLVSKIATECKYFANVYRALTLEKLDDSAKSVLKRFRKQYSLDSLSLNELKYLFA